MISSKKTFITASIFSLLAASCAQAGCEEDKDNLKLSDLTGWIDKNKGEKDYPVPSHNGGDINHQYEKCTTKVESETKGDHISIHFRVYYNICGGNGGNTRPLFGPTEGTYPNQLAPCLNWKDKPYEMTGEHTSKGFTKGTLRCADHHTVMEYARPKDGMKDLEAKLKKITDAATKCSKPAGVPLNRDTGARDNPQRR